jgi:hypothetical protein
MVFALLLAQTGVNGIACTLIDKAEATTRQCLPTLEMPDHLLFIGKKPLKNLIRAALNNRNNIPCSETA